MRPKKPWPAFPLTPHPNGSWCKKINGKLHYFGPWDDPDAALARYRAQADKLHAGEPLGVDASRVTVKDILDRVLESKLADAEAGKIVKSWYAAYLQAAVRFTRYVGAIAVTDLTPDHFSGFLASRQGKGVNKTVQCIRTLFNHAAGEDWCQPVRFGKQFKKTDRAFERRLRRERLFTPAECQKMVEGAEGQIKAMILLGLNGGMGQSDVANLRGGDVTGDLIDYRRHKTGAARMIPLWSETVVAISTYLSGKKPEDLVFVTAYGNAWVREQASRKSSGKVSTIDAVSLEFGKLLARMEIWKTNKAGRPVSDGRGFYTLRRTFRTAADGQGDQRAIDLVMGHTAAANDMGAVYIQRIERERLDSVVVHVRKILFGGK